MISRTSACEMSRRYPLALLSPGLARRFPFFAPLWTRAEVSFRLGAGEWGDCQMTIKASGRSALILATGLFVCFAGPSQAEPDDDVAVSSKPESAPGAPMALNKYVKRSARHAKSYAHRKSSKLALKSSRTEKAAAPDVADNDGGGPTAIPPSVANANAQ